MRAEKLSVEVLGGPLDGKRLDGCTLPWLSIRGEGEYRLVKGAALPMPKPSSPSSTNQQRPVHLYVKPSLIKNGLVKP